MEKENRPSSIGTYRTALRKIVATIGDISFPNINQNTVLELKEKMMEQGISDNRRSLVISVLKNFLVYLRDYVGLEVFDPARITIPKVRKKLVQILTLREINWFINELPEKTLKERRFKALVCILADSGARISEILGLERDVDLNAREAVVLGKGGKFRPIYWGGRAAHYLGLYQESRPEWDASECLFGNVNKSERFSGKWDKNDVNRTFRKWSQKLGRRIHCHLFRSSFLTNCVHADISLSAVSKAMGHSDVRTSMRYFAPMTDEQTRETFQEYFQRKATVDARMNVVNEQKGGEKYE